MQEYDRGMIERPLIELISRLLTSYQLQDVRCFCLSLRQPKLILRRRRIVIVREMWSDQERQLEPHMRLWRSFQRDY